MMYVNHGSPKEILMKPLFFRFSQKNTEEFEVVYITKIVLFEKSTNIAAIKGKKHNNELTSL